MGDFNKDISRLNAEFNNYYLGLQIAHPNKFTHKNKSTIDYALLSPDI